MIRDTGKELSGNRLSNTRKGNSGAITEYYNALLRNLRLHANGGMDVARAIGVASVPGSSRASVVATNLAICIANADQGRDVLLVCADPRNRVAETTFSLKKDGGLYNVLQGDMPLSDAVQQTNIANLRAVSCGRYERGMEPVSCLVKFQDILNEVKRDRAMVIIDLPAASELTPCFDMAAGLDGVVLEIEAGNVKRNVATRALEQLRLSDATVLGCVFRQA